MEIRIAELLEGARQARGTAVIIDVFRAFSVECWLFARGARRVAAVGELETAYALKRRHPDALLIGERKGRPLPGFDCGNSPALLAGIDVRSKTVIHTTSSGTQGIAAAAGAEEILAGSLVNARAIAEYLLARQPRAVTLVCMGLGGNVSSEEDVLCARYIESMLHGAPWEAPRLRAGIERLKDGAGKRFFDSALQDIMPREDFDLCTAADRFPFVLRAAARDGYFEMEALGLGPRPGTTR